MKLKDLAQLEFSTIFFDTLFGLILFFGLDSFLDIQGTASFLFYLLATVIVVHWWLLFKSADDAFSEEVTDSAVDLVFGIIDIILIDYVILLAKTSNYSGAIGYLIGLFVCDLLWALAWRFVGTWQTTNEAKIKLMEQELNNTIIIDLVAIILFSGLFYFGTELAELSYVILAVIFYVFYIILSFRNKVINLKIF